MQSKTTACTTAMQSKTTECTTAKKSKTSKPASARKKFSKLLLNNAMNYIYDIPEIPNTFPDGNKPY